MQKAKSKQNALKAHRTKSIRVGITFFRPRDWTRFGQRVGRRHRPRLRFPTLRECDETARRCVECRRAECRVNCRVASDAGAAEFALDSAGRKSIEASTFKIPERTHVVTLCHCSLLYLYPSQIAMALMKNLLDTSHMSCNMQL